MSHLKLLSRTRGVIAITLGESLKFVSRLSLIKRMCMQWTFGMGT